MLIDGISIDLRRIDTIVSWQEPQLYYKLQQFLRFCNFYRRFIKGYLMITALLIVLLQGSEKGRKLGRLALIDEERTAFRCLLIAF